MKRPDSFLFTSPHSKMFENTVKNHQVLIISLLQIILDLLWIIALSHQTIGRLIDVIVAILSD